MNKQELHDLAWNIVDKWRDRTDGTIVEFGFETLIEEVSNLLEINENAAKLIFSGQKLWALIETWEEAIIECFNIDEKVTRKMLCAELRDVLEKCELKPGDKYEIITYNDKKSLNVKNAVLGAVNDGLNASNKALNNDLRKQKETIDTLHETCAHYEMEIRAYHSRVKELEANELKYVAELEDLETKVNPKQLEFNFSE